MNEKDVCERVIKLLVVCGFDKENFGIEQRASGYISLIYCDNDFFRTKYSDNARWISIRLAKEDRDVNDIRFEAQEKKGQLHWKANIKDIKDVDKFIKELQNACVYLAKPYYEKRNNISEIVIGYDFKNKRVI